MDEKIAEQLKEISLEILIDFDEFCKEYKLEYKISFGTLLGAVRHKGFIPWDDDVDVDMPIKDYIQFRKYWLKYGDKEKYFLQTKKTDPKLPTPFHRLRLNNTATITTGYETFPIHWGLPLDIFPIYNMPTNKLLKKVMFKLYKYSSKFGNYDWKKPQSNKIISWFNMQLSLLCLQGMCVISWISKSSPYIYNPYGYKKKTAGKKEWLHPSKMISFEGKMFQTYNNPHEYLVWQYGEDYMTPPPEDQRGGHPVGIIDLEHDGEYYTKYLIRNK